MKYLDEAIFGHEVLDRLPKLARAGITKRKSTRESASQGQGFGLSVRIIWIMTPLRKYSRCLGARLAEIIGGVGAAHANGFGLTPTEHETIRKRCQEFPLSVTVKRPRFAWRADRKTQAGRIYRPGERFKT